MDTKSLKHVWAALPVDSPLPRLQRRRVMADEMMVSHVVLEEGLLVAPHQHVNEQITVVLEGRLRFRLGESEDAPDVVDVAAGEVLVLPSLLWHGAEALERTVVLDLFAPPSAETGIDRLGVEG